MPDAHADRLDPEDAIDATGLPPDPSAWVVVVRFLDVQPGIYRTTLSRPVTLEPSRPTPYCSRTTVDVAEPYSEVLQRRSNSRTASAVDPSREVLKGITFRSVLDVAPIIRSCLG
jgi:hypothetical protein